MPSSTRSIPFSLGSLRVVVVAFALVLMQVRIAVLTICVGVKRVGCTNPIVRLARC
jgi:hypothetical protein